MLLDQKGFWSEGFAGRAILGPRRAFPLGSATCCPVSCAGRHIRSKDTTSSAIQGANYRSHSVQLVPEMTPQRIMEQTTAFVRLENKENGFPTCCSGESPAASSCPPCWRWPPRCCLPSGGAPHGSWSCWMSTFCCPTHWSLVSAFVQCLSPSLRRCRCPSDTGSARLFQESYMSY